MKQRWFMSTDLGQNLGFLWRCFAGYSGKRSCPGCGHITHRLVDRKYLLARLFECAHCHLMFRFPIDDTARMEVFYQQEYRQEDRITTDLPGEKEWQQYESAGFGEKDVSHYVDLFRHLFPERSPDSIRVLDYGCSWGYQTRQFLTAGFDCQGFELSRIRAAFGRDRLGLPITSDFQQIRGGLDVFFASHVIEHVPSPAAMLEMADRLLKPGGYFCIESPNGSEIFKSKHPGHFHKLWGRVHPNFISPRFYHHWLNGRPAFITSSPFDGLRQRVSAWDRLSFSIDRLEGPSMLMITRKSCI
jgi:SAM-dependent methyltransferase